MALTIYTNPDDVTTDIEWAVISTRFVTNDEEFHHMWQCEDEVDSPPWKFCDHWLGFNGYLINLGEI